MNLRHSHSCQKCCQIGFSTYIILISIRLWPCCWRWNLVLLVRQGCRGEHPGSPCCRRSGARSRASSSRSRRRSTPTRRSTSWCTTSPRCSAWSPTAHRSPRSPTWHSSAPVKSEPLTYLAKPDAKNGLHVSVLQIHFSLLRNICNFKFVWILHLQQAHIQPVKAFFSGKCVTRQHVL